MHIDWWTLALQTINALVLIWLLKRFLLSPVAAIIETRREAAAALLDEAQAAKSAAGTIEADLRRQAAEAAAGRDRTLQEAARQAEALRSDMLAEARTAADKIKLQTEAESELALGEAHKDLARQASRLAIEIAGKLLDRLPDSARIDGFIDGLADAIAALPDESRAALAKDTAPLTLSTARPLSGGQQEHCLARIADAVGHPVSLAFEADPALVAGLEIQSAYVQVRNSFRADLEQISKELGAGG